MNLFTLRSTWKNLLHLTAFEEVEDATIPDEKKVKITTKNLVGGKWKTSVKYVKREE